MVGFKGTRVDVTVIGGGPAGTSAARLLAAWGHRVTLLTRPAPRPSLAETIPPSTGRLLDMLGWREEIDRAGFIRTTGNTVLWESDAEDVPAMRPAFYLDGTLGYQVDRTRLDRIMLKRVAAEVHTIHETTVTGVAGHRVEYSTTTGHREVTASWILDCSGRAGVVARLGWRRAVPHLRTLAVAAVWKRADGWPLVDPTHTVVASHANGWAWSVPLSERERQVTVMLDPRLTSVSGRADLAAAYDHELRNVPSLWEDTRQATLCGEPFARDASPYTADQVARPGLLLVGDAASFVDPLSSYGIKKAFASAWLAAVVVNTCIGDEAMLAPSLALYEARERAMYDALERQRVALAQTALSDGVHSEFWSARSDPTTDPLPNEDIDVAALRSDRTVQAAFDELKRRDHVRLACNPALERVREPTVRGNRIVLLEHLRLPDTPRPVRFVRNIDLVALVDLAPSASQVPDLFDVYCREVAPVPLPDFLGALSLLLARRALVFA